MKQSFEWRNSSFEVRAKLGIDTFLYYALIYDIGKLVLAEQGLDIDKDGAPRHIDMLITRFVDWASVTEIVGDDLAHCRLVGATDKAVLAYYHSWCSTVFANPELWSSWDSAYRSAQLEDNSEKKEVNAEIGVTS